MKIIIFILGYILIGILIQLLVKGTRSQEQMEENSYMASQMMGFDHMTREDIKVTCWHPAYTAINVIGWPINLCCAACLVIRIIIATSKRGD